MNGALISFNEGVVIPTNEKCSLTIYSDEQRTLIKSDVTVIHSNFTMVGIKFSSEDASISEALEGLIQRLASGDGGRIKETDLFYRESEG